MEQPDVGELWHHMEESQNEVVNVETFDLDQNLSQPIWIHQHPWLSWNVNHCFGVRDHYSISPLCFYASALLPTHLQASTNQELPLARILLFNYIERKKKQSLSQD